MLIIKSTYVLLVLSHLSFIKNIQHNVLFDFRFNDRITCNTFISQQQEHMCTHKYTIIFIYMLLKQLYNVSNDNDINKPQNSNISCQLFCLFLVFANIVNIKSANKKKKKP